MKIKVIPEQCIGCGSCEAIAENLFKLNDEGISEAVVEEVPEGEEVNAQDACDSCPTAAIVIEKE